MKITSLEIPEVILIEPEVYKDERGFFFESFNQNLFNSVLNNQITFVQDNISNSKKGTLRGLHFQYPPMEQGKLVSVLSGEVLDVILDIRKSSPTYGNSIKITLSEQNHKMIWIPEGFAHGFLSLSSNAIFSYKTTNYYSKEHESSIDPFDPDLSINWPKMKYILSNKDKKAKKFSDL